MAKRNFVNKLIRREEIKEDITHILFDATGHTPIVIPVINKV